MNDLKTYSLRYRSSELTAWRRGEYDLLSKSNASEFIRELLIAKAATRRKGFLQRGHQLADRRFFGEAFVAAHPKFAHQDGWYGSFKWLTSPAWCEPHASFPSGLQHDFKRALDTHVRNLSAVQEKSSSLRTMLGGERPVPPDLWLFTGSAHRFIEVKLPRDFISERQLAGLGLIATSLKTSYPVSVEVITLFSDDGPERVDLLSNEQKKLFTSFCHALREWSWQEGPVDLHQEHIEIRYGEASEASWHKWKPVALIGRPKNQVFPVQWLVPPNALSGNMITNVRRELDFYLVQKHEPDPWGYAIYHCGTTANVYSSVHWSYYSLGRKGVQESS